MMRVESNLGTGIFRGILPFLLLLLLLVNLQRADAGALVIPAPGVDAIDAIDTIGNAAPRPLDTLWHDVQGVVTDAWGLMKRPGSWGREDWVRAGLLAAGGAAVVATDRGIHDEVAGWRGTDGDAIVEVGDYMGHNSVGVIAIGALYVPGLLLDLPWLRLAGRHLGQTILYSALVGSLLKGGLGRGRPFLGKGPYRFRGPWQGDNAWMSLPSGHTIVAFSIASTLSATIDRPWATALLYCTATVTGLGRLYLNQHWGSDVFIAAILSSAIGHGVVTLSEHQSISEDEEISLQSITPAVRFSLSPVPDGLYAGITLSW